MCFNAVSCVSSSLEGSVASPSLFFPFFHFFIFPIFPFFHFSIFIVIYFSGCFLLIGIQNKLFGTILFVGKTAFYNAEGMRAISVSSAG